MPPIQQLIARRPGLRGLFLAGILVSLPAGLSAEPLPFDRDDWDDLEREAPYGSEKESRYAVDALVFQIEDWPEHYHTELLFGLFSYTAYPRFSRWQLWPLASSRSATRDSRKDSWFLPLYYTSSFSEPGASSRFWLTPLGMYSYEGYESGIRAASTEAIPENAIVSTQSDHSSRWITPLAYYEYTENQADDATNWRSELWVPFLPLIVHETGSHTPGYIRLLNIWWKAADSDGSDESGATGGWHAGIAPLLLYESGPDGYFVLNPLYFQLYQDPEGSWLSFGPLHYYERENPDSDDEQSLLVLGPFMRSVDRGANRYSHHVLPFYYTSHEDNENHRSRFWLTPLAYYDHEESRSGIDLTWHTQLWVPLLPLFVRETSSTAAPYTRVANVWWQSAYENADRETGWRTGLAPIFFFESGKDGHLVLAPLYFQTEQDPEGTWQSFGPLHYYERHRPNTPEQSSYLVLGPYLRSEDRGGDDASYSYYAHLLPFYLHSLEGGAEAGNETELQITFPLYFNYRSPDRDLHVNISGLSLDTEKIPLPRLRRRQNGAETNFVVDNDVAFLYNLVRVSSRTALPGTRSETADNADGAAADDAPVALEWTPSDTDTDTDTDTEASDEPLLQRERQFGVDRQTALRYYGVQTLFGIFAYEEADHWRHIRVLPLSWFSWDTRSDDSVSVIPAAYLGYTRDDLAYRVIMPAFIPVYASERDGQRIREAYLGPVYIRERDPEGQSGEDSVLWPLTNFYANPVERGGWAVPLFYYAEQVASQTETLIAPLYYSQRSPDHTERLLFPLYYGEERRYTDDAAAEIAPENTDETAPAMAQSACQETTSWFLAAPGIYRHHNQYSDEDGPADQLAPCTGTTRTNVLGLLNWSSASQSSADGAEESHLQSAWLLPVFAWEGSTAGAPERCDGSGLYLFPVYTGCEYGEDWLHVFPLFFSWRSESAQSYFAGGLYWKAAEGYSSQNLLYLLRHSRSDSYGEDGETTEAHHQLGLGLDLLRFDWNSAGSFRTATGYGYLSEFERHAPGQVNANLLWMLYERNAPDERFHTSFWPLWWVDSNPSEFFWAATPLLSYANYDSGGTDEWLLGGALWYRSYDAEFRDGRTWLLLGTLYEEVRRRERGYHSRGSMWGLLWQQQSEAANGYSKFSVLKFLYSRTQHQGSVRHRVLGIPFGGGSPAET